MDRGHQPCIRRLGREEADHRHRLLLRAGQERIRRRAGENRHEIPASHPQPLDPTLGMDYGSIELLPKGWTNGDFQPRRADWIGGGE
jgi:hypothetical protein